MSTSSSPAIPTPDAHRSPVPNSVRPALSHERGLLQWDIQHDGQLWQDRLDYLINQPMCSHAPAVEQCLVTVAPEARPNLERALQDALIVTGRERLASALRAADQRLHGILDSIFTYVGLLSPDGILLAVNHRPLETAGLTRAEVVGRPFPDCYWWSHSPEAQARLREAIRQAAQGEMARYDTPLRIANGEIITIDFALRPLRDPSGRVEQLVASAVDITERKRVEESLRESEARFRQVVENIREVFWMTDVEMQQVHYVSPGYERVWGRSRQELETSPQAWFESIHAEDRDRVQAAAMTRQLAGHFDEEYRIVRPDGTIRWIRDRAFPVREPDGTVRRIVGIAEDITERKQLEAQFLRAQRMDNLGSLAGGIAHDLNNILAPIMLAVDFIRLKATNPEIAPLLDTVEANAKRGAGMIRQILSFARGLSGEKTPVQLRHLVRDLTALVRETFPASIEFRADVPAGLPPVLGDATQLYQVLLNLCVNARDAMPRGGRLELSARCETLDGAQPGRHVRLTVTDDGTGMPPEVLAKIFDQFFTTKAPGKGTGLGLATVQSIVQSHGGFVRVESEPGKGTQFHVFLPVAPDAGADTEQNQKVRLPPGNGETILVVDDEAAILQITKAALNACNYRVLTAGDGTEAVAQFAQHRADIQAVITDMNMPHMDGATTIRALRKMNPNARVIAISGLAEQEHRLQNAGLRVDAFLTKPFTVEQLAQAIHDVLHEAKADG